MKAGTHLLGRVRPLLAMVFAAVVLAACGGGSGDSSTAPPPDAPSPTPVVNVAPLVVDGGTDGSAFNSPFVSVTVCQPGTGVCATIDHVLVDTGSSGLRLAASVLPAAVALPRVSAPSGAPLAQCAQFASGFAWGSVRAADVAIVGERANAIPIQLVDDPSAGVGAPPASCRAAGANIGVGRGTNGILGVGFHARDCGAACAADPPPPVYYACAAAGCAPTAAPLASQVQNPVTGFAVDNNGVAIVLPNVPLGGLASIGGSLVFGIGTQANNQPGAVKVFSVDRQDNFTTLYKGVTFTAFIDSGSNGLFFPDPSLPKCSGDFYCPAAPQRLSAIVSSPNGSNASIDFDVENVNAMPLAALGHAAADDGVPEFDWGLPFFFGRTVWTAINGAATPLGPGPFWAF